MNETTASPPRPPAAKRYQSGLWRIVRQCISGVQAGGTILDAGCGHGFISGEILRLGYRVYGIDSSAPEIKHCRRDIPEGTFHQASICDPEIRRLIADPVDAILAIEVIEHLYSPAGFAENCRALLKPGGFLVISTPFHGFWKNLLLAATGRLDRHFQADHEGGHIKFWSYRALATFLRSHGFEVTEFHGYGRVPLLWNSMIVKAVKTA